jgi:uncharacterized metal-binding protein YceD (DUF177 family)
MKPGGVIQVQVRNLAPEGIRVAGEIAPGELDIPDDERTACAGTLHFAAHVTPAVGAIVVAGQIEGQLRCRCDRCLTYYTRRLERIPVSHQYLNFHEDILDLTEDVRDDILLTFPQRNLCRDDCRGLCTVCGQNLNARECGCHQIRNADAPWGALNNLRLPAEMDENASRNSSNRP